MNASDRAAFTVAFDRLFATWLKSAPTDRFIGAALQALDTFDIDDVTTAIDALIAAGGTYLPSIAQLRDECRFAEHASRRRYAVPAQADGVCPRCDGIGQYQTSTDTYAFQVAGHAPGTGTRTYTAPCPDCARGRKIAACREATRHEATHNAPVRGRDQDDVRRSA